MFKQWLEQFKSHKLWVSGEASGEIDSLTADSREIGPIGKQTVFFARKGIVQDGHNFLSALTSEPTLAAFVVENMPENFRTEKPVIVVRDSTEAMALAAKSFYEDPTAHSFCAAVTGTNGKTTTTFLLQALLKEAGLRPARLGTIETHFENTRIPSNLTTPDFSFIQKTFKGLKDRGANAFVFEASSHALEQRRLLGLELNAAIFTNLTPEHLDYHRTMEVYYASKKRLFSELLVESQKNKKVAIVPTDGIYGSRLVQELHHRNQFKIISWGFSEEPLPNYLHIESWNTHLQGSECVISGLGLTSQKFHTPLIGKHNIENIAGMIGMGCFLELSPQKIQNALNAVHFIPGRLERILIPGGPTVFVDYAHTPDALENVLITLRSLTSGKLRVVLGCGGDRDRSKRPKMGEVAELYADDLFVTSDNPRTEDPEQIIQEILTGLQNIKPTQVKVDRRKAIQQSLKGLSSEDVVLIAGKGHENYQILGTQKIHFDDREVVLEGVGT